MMVFRFWPLRLQVRPQEESDPLAHPEIARMDARMLADLPFPSYRLAELPGRAVAVCPAPRAGGARSAAISPRGAFGWGGRSGVLPL